MTCWHSKKFSPQNTFQSKWTSSANCQSWNYHWVWLALKIWTSPWSDFKEETKLKEMMAHKLHSCKSRTKTSLRETIKFLVGSISEISLHIVTLPRNPPQEISAFFKVILLRCEVKKLFFRKKEINWIFL